MRNLFPKIFCTAVLALASLTLAGAQDIKTHEAKKARLEDEIAVIDKQLAEISGKSRNALSQLTLIRKKVSNRKALVAESDRQIRRYADEIYLTQRQINKMQARIDTLSAYYARLVRGAYKNRDAKIWYMYILASEDLGQAFRRYSYFKNLSSSMKLQAQEIKESKSALEAKKAELQKLKKEAEKLKVQRQKEYSSLKTEEAQSAKVVSRLKRNRTKYQKELAAKKKEVEALNKQIEKLVREAMRRSQGSQEIDYELAREFSANKGKLPWPASGPVVDHFGQQYHPVFKTLRLPFNNGVNIAVPKGTEVKAVFDGVVKQIITMRGYNQCVLVQHGNYFTFYCKLKSVSVKAGDKVVTGQKIGVVDTINGDTQVHFQVWKNQSPQNPETWLR